MDDTASSHVYHDVGVVSIFNLQNEANQRVRSQRSCKIVYRLIVFLRLGSKLELNLIELDEVNVFVENLEELLFDLVNAHGVGAELEETALLSRGEDVVSSKFEIKPSLLPDLVHGFDQLHRELFSPQIITTLHYHSQKFPGLQMTIFGFLSDSLVLLLSCLKIKDLLSDLGFVLGRKIRTVLI